MKTIFVTSYHSFIARNILQTDVLKILEREDLRIVILGPPKKVSYFKKNFEYKNVEVVGIEPRKRFLDNLVYFLSVCLISAENLFVGSLHDEKRYMRFYLAHLLHFLFHRFFLVKKILRYLFNRFMAGRTFKGLLMRYKPGVVFSTDIYHVYDRDLVVEAKKAGIPTIGMVRSWDNVTTKGVMLAIPDKIIVPNEILRGELWEYNRISKDKIFVSGVPHYDACVKPRALSKEQFFQKIGLDLGKKTIFFAPAGALLYKYDGEILKLLQRLKNEGRFSREVQFLVRLHPGSVSNLNGFVRDGDFIIDEPGLNLDGIKKQSELTEDDAERLNDSLYYSDIIMTAISTIAIDGAVFDKPTVIFSFNPVSDRDDDIKKFMRYYHFRKFISFDLCKVANSEDELVRHINNYLENPALDRDKRRKIVDKYCYKLDGNSSRRVAEFILKDL